MTPRFFLALVLWLGCLGTVASLRAQPAAPATPGDSMLQQEMKQQQIKATTRRVGEQLETIIADFDRNGIAGEDVKVLRAIRGVLGYLTEKDMEKVIAFLQQSRASADPGASARQATEAYAGQKAIVVQLQQLVLEYQRQQALYEISLRLKELATRQSANMWLGVGLAKSTENRPSFNSFDENQKISLRYQQSEQNPLKDEVAAILKKLEKLSTEITDGPTAEKPRAALQQAKEGGLMPALESAATELRDDNLKLLSAIGNEKKARDQMREIARLLILSTDVADALKGAIQDIDRAIDSEKKVIADTRATIKREEAEKRSTEQAAVVDDTDLIRKDIDSLAPIAAEHLKAATDKMQEARNDLASGGDTKRRIEKALPRQEEAVVQMQEARHALEEQLAKLEEIDIKPENNLVALKEIQEKVRELIKKEEELKDETAAINQKKELPAKAPKQGELKDQSQDLQARAAAPSPMAAQSLGEAASQMQKAQNSLAQQKNNPDAQQASIESLQKADQQLSQDISDLEKAMEDLAKIEEMQKKLAVIIEDQQKTQFDTAKEAVKPEPAPEPTKQLASGQEKLGRDTGALQQEAEPLVPSAASHLGSASNHMDAAKSELAKPAAKPAQPRQTGALSELYIAKREFEKKADELRDKLGLPPGDNTDALAEAQKRIEQAQKDVSEALKELGDEPLKDMLLKQQEEIAQALNEMKQDSPDSAKMARAEQAAAEAAQQLARNHLSEAIRAMDAALDVMREMDPPSETDSDSTPEDPAGSGEKEQPQNADGYALRWAAVLVQTPGTPKLMLAPGPDGRAMLSWSNDASGLTLQASPTLSPPAWTNVADGSQSSWRLPASRLKPFYRLVKQ